MSDWSYFTDSVIVQGEQKLRFRINLDAGRWELEEEAMTFIFQESIQKLLPQGIYPEL